MENKNGTISSLIYSIFAILLFITFMILKLCNVINWSWWWVTAPLWAGSAISVAFTIVVLIGYIIYLLTRTARVKKKEKWLKHFIDDDFN